MTLGLGIRANDGATLKGVEDLGGVEAEHREVTVVKNASAVALDSEGMGGVVDNLEVVAIGDALDRLDVTWIAVAVYRQNGGGLRGDGRFDLGWVEVEGARLNVDEDRGNAVPEQRMGGGDERVRSSNNLTGDAQGLECCNQRYGVPAEWRRSAG